MAFVLRQYPRNVFASRICFFAFFGIANGLGTWLPWGVGGASQGVHRSPKSLTFTLGMTIAYPCSSAFMMFSLERFGRIRTAVTAFVLAGLFAAAFASGAPGRRCCFAAAACDVLLQFNLAGNSMQIFASEVFPTNARASGFGLAHSGGRIGAAIIVPGFLYIQTTWGVPAVFGYDCGHAGGGRRCSDSQIGHRDPGGLALDAIAPPDRLTATIGEVVRS